MGDTVTYERSGRIATITYNRPEALNAINHELRTDLNAAWEEFRNDDDAWVGSSPAPDAHSRLAPTCARPRRPRSTRSGKCRR